MNYLPDYDFAIAIPDQETNRKVQEKFFRLGARWDDRGESSREILRIPVTMYGGKGAIRLFSTRKILAFCSISYYQDMRIPFIHFEIFLYDDRQAMMITPEVK